MNLEYMISDITKEELLNIGWNPPNNEELLPEYAGHRIGDCYYKTFTSINVLDNSQIIRKYQLNHCLQTMEISIRKNDSWKTLYAGTSLLPKDLKQLELWLFIEFYYTYDK